MPKGSGTPKIDRKARIVQAAMKLFIEQGVAQTKMAEIADKAGVDQPLIRYYFPTLDSLYAEVVAVALEDLKQASLQAVAQAGSDPGQLLVNYVRAPFEWGSRNPGPGSLWLYFYYLASFNPQFSLLNRTIRETGRDRITVMLYTGIEKGAFRLPPGLSVPELALALQGLITGNTIMAFTEGHNDWPRFADATCKAVLAVLGAAGSGAGGADPHPGPGPSGSAAPAKRKKPR